ncbi:hypothetical protein CES86_4370 [Brucella lupini]|uniref:Uncharacterized protein n=1 Tax=Brucella lupini TaxID=255457 RepID=A0A256GFP0_9HYPH|nr:hypothetical protein CES86_4370 [Brucella lupini]
MKHNADRENLNCTGFSCQDIDQSLIQLFPVPRKTDAPEY